MKLVMFFNKSYRVYEFHKPKTKEMATMELLWDSLDRKRKPNLITLLDSKTGSLCVECLHTSTDK